MLFGDFIAALQNANNEVPIKNGNTIIHEDPGCSIDPDPKVIVELDRITLLVDSRSGQFNNVNF